MKPPEDCQRLDAWLWCARVAKHRSDCARLIAEGRVRINRQPTDKPHARLRAGDVLTFSHRDDIVVWRVLFLAARRGPAIEARTLYAELTELSGPCAAEGPAAYRGFADDGSDGAPGMTE